jgi:alpha-tubulin suppressor-like RCC1 family protein
MACTTDICGEWEDEQDEPTGQCTPRRLKRTCDVAILYTNVAQSASDTCPDGLVGDVISVTVEAGTINNPFSVAAANAEALASAEAQVAALRALSPCLYPNTEQVCTETCPEGTVGDPITVTIAAGEYTAETQEEADALALAAACEQAALLRAETPCYWENAEQECTETCPEGLTGDPITVTVAAGEYISYVSQGDADAQALAAACAEAAELREATPCVADEIEGFSLWGAGDNDDGALGIGSEIAQLSLVPVDYAPEYIAIAAGGDFTLGLKGDGTLWAWGDDREGALGQGPTTLYTAANDVVLEYHAPIQVGTDNTWASISAGQDHWQAIKTDGTLWGCGWNSDSRAGFPLGVEPFDDIYYVPTQIGTDSDWMKVSSGRRGAAMLKTDGTLWIVGQHPVSGVDLDTPTQEGVETFAQVSSGNDLIVLIKSNGELWALNWFDGVDVTLVPTRIGTDLWSAAGVSSGYVVAAIKTDGTLWTYGIGGGYLGQGDTTARWTLTQVGVINDWVRLAGSTVPAYPLTIAQRASGEMWAFGDNSWGAMGIGVATGIETSPVQIGSDNLWQPLFATSGLRSFFLRTGDTEPAPIVTNSVAYGGSYGEAGLYSIHTFGTSGDFTVYTPTSMEWLIVGGGGGGGGIGAGGGGEVVLGSGILSAGTYPVVIGNAGTAGFNQDRGGNGTSSTFNGSTAIGGGGGGGYETFSGSDKDGKNGASGGGSGMDSSVAGTPGTGTAGFNGGTGVITAGGQGIAGGGGGGSFGLGGNGSGTDEASGTGGAGGTGTTSSISGSAKVYGAGGGGGGWTTAGAGGSSGVGGKGSTRTTQTPTTESYGQPYSGSGGGGGFGSFQFAGKGAIGVVVIRYLTPP